MNVNSDHPDLLNEYHEDVKWLREHVARDDIYDFAHQAFMIASFFLGKVVQQSENVMDVFKEDAQACHYMKMLLSIRSAKEDGFTGILTTNISIVENDSMSDAD